MDRFDRQEGIVEYRFIEPERFRLPFKILPLQSLLAYFAREVSAPHRTDFHKLFWFGRGSGTLAVDFAEYDVQGPRLCFVSSRQVFWLKRHAFEDGFGLFFLDEFLQGDVSGALSLPLGAGPVLHPTHRETTVLTGLFGQLWAEEQAGADAATPHVFRNLLYVLLHQTRRIASGQGAPRRPLTQDQATYDRFRRLLDERFREVRTVAAFADLLCVTPKKLNRVTSEIAGVQASRVIRERVLTEAKRLLAYSPMSIQSIAFALGFEDSSNFTKFFKSHTHRTPKQYRSGFGLS